MSQIKRQTKSMENIQESKEPKFVLVSRQGVSSTKTDDEDTPKGDCESLGLRQDYKVNDLSIKLSALLPGASQSFKEMMRNKFGKVSYEARLSGTQAVATLSSSVATLKASWDPSGLTSFTDFALLFSQYKVKKVSLRVWFPGESSVAGSGTSIFLVGADPGMAISGTPTTVTVSDLQHSEAWNAIITSKKVAEFVSNASLVPLTTDRQGFLDVSSSWSGQTCVYAAADGTSTLTAFNYQLIFDVVFRNRF
jgi:hypothetical protein